MSEAKTINGWNSFDAYNWSITEEEFKANAEEVDKYFKPFGYEYVVLDFIWYMPGNDSNPNPHQDEEMNTLLYMDMYGRLRPAPGRFPSSLPGSTLKPIADFIHGKGLKMGLHIMRGIPCQAVRQNNPIKGTPYFARDIAFVDKDDQCPWLNVMHGIDMEKPGAQEYLNSIFELYAEWGIDLVKVDDIGYPYHKAEIEGYRKAIENCGREMILSLSPGPAPVEEREHLAKYADMWRISADFWDNWTQLEKLYGLFCDWMVCDRNGAYPDGDMIPFSKLSLRGPMGEPRYSHFTHDEKMFLMTLLCLNNSPLMMGGDLTVIDDDARKILTNSAVLAVQRFSKNAKKWDKPINGQSEFWVSEDRNNDKIRYCAVFNLSNEMSVCDLPISAFSGFENYSIQDLWNNTVERGSDLYRVVLRPHSAALFMVVKSI